MARLMKSHDRYVLDGPYAEVIRVPLHVFQQSGVTPGVNIYRNLVEFSAPNGDTVRYLVKGWDAVLTELILSRLYAPPKVDE